MKFDSTSDRVSCHQLHRLMNALAPTTLPTCPASSLLRPPTVPTR